MVKQKVVMKVSMIDEKSRSRVLKTVVGVPGCLSVSLEGKERDMVVVIGEGMDPVVLVKSLRKKVGYAELISVGSADYKKLTEEKKLEKPMTMMTQGFPVLQHVNIPDYNPDPCSIL